MKRTGGRLNTTIAAVLMITAILIAGTGCGEPAPSTPTDISYQSTHSPADAEYIISWDSIVSKCPEIGTYEKQENFVHRGESMQSNTGGTPTLEDNSPMAWLSTRFVLAQETPEGEKFRGFMVWISFFETTEYLDEYIEQIKLQGLPLKQDGDYMTSVLESGLPTKSLQMHTAGKNFHVMVMETASSAESLFIAKDALTELMSTAKSRISSLEITALPSGIPERKTVEATPDEWSEYITFDSEELPTGIRVGEDQYYNNLWFTERPLINVFSFRMDKDWRFTMTATGEIGTKFEAYITVTTLGEEPLSYSYDHPFSLYEETVTFTREQPLEAGYTPPVDVEFKLYYDRPMDWTIRIEK